MKQTKLRPLLDRVIIKRLDPEGKSRGGIILPDNAKEKPRRGVIISVGPGKDGEPIPLKEGETVLFANYSGHEFKDGELDVLVMNQDDVLAVVESV